MLNPYAIEIKDPKEGGLAEEKLAALKKILRDMGSVLVAFSGGVDSSFLLKVAVTTLGENACALTATSPTYLESELEEATDLAGKLGAKHIIVDSNELTIEGFADNPENRCYFCKTELFKICSEKARDLGIRYVLDGTNSDDLNDFRPGSGAAKELGVRSPLEEAGLTKKEIRYLSKKMGLSTWDKPNLACLSSRFPYGVTITGERLERIKACEGYLRELGFHQVRVRYHDTIARIEVLPEMLKLFIDGGIREGIIKKFKEQGFTYVTLDLEGYRSGSANEVLKAKVDKKSAS